MRLLTVLCICLLQCQLSGTSWNATEYVKRNQLQQHWADSFFFNRYHFKGNENVLDIGCGDGEHTRRIASKTSGNVIGLDNSPSMIAHAIANHAADNLTFKFSAADDSKFYFRLENSCDLVVSFHCLHWVRDHDTVLRGIKRVLVPDGVAALRLCSDGFDPIQEIADRLCRSDKWKSAFSGFEDPIQRFSAEEYRSKLERYDFKIIRIAEAIDNDALASEEELKAHIISWLPHFKFLGTHLGTLFIDEIAQEYLSKYSTDVNGNIVLPDCYLEVEIQK